MKQPKTPPATSDPGTVRVTLPVSGEEILVSTRRLTVLDNIRAADLLKEQMSNPVAVHIAKVVLCASHADGRALIYEDCLSWDEADMEAVMGAREAVPESPFVPTRVGKPLP